MIDPDEEPQPEPPWAGNEIDTILGSLERQRKTFAWKTGGLDAAGLQARLGPSAITLGGLLKHMARVEDSIFAVRILGRDPRSPWDTHDWDWDWQSAAQDSPEELYALWRDAVERSRTLVKEALGEGGLDMRARFKEFGGHVSMRRVMFDMIEEYARHVGHADLIRESIDGLVGEDPPWPPS